MIALAVLIGGAFGAVVRGWVEQHFEPTRPWPTAVVNVVGSIILGFVVGSGELLTSLVGVGFCGALTTFSGHSLHTVRLVREHRIGLAVAFTVLSAAAAVVGYWASAGL